MAEERTSGEPTEPPSDKKLRDARRRGEVVHSREVTSWAVFVAASGVLLWTWSQGIARLQVFSKQVFIAASRQILAPWPALETGFQTMVLILLPVLGAVLVMGLLASLVQVRPLFSLQPLKPQLARLDPLRQLRQIFGKKALFELVKSVIKLGGIGYIAGSALWEQLPLVLSTLGQRPEVLLRVISGVLQTIALRVIILAAILAVADWLFQRYSFLRRMRMTKVEVQREQKESEGDPQHKAERKRVHREILEHRMFEEVAHADCVIINPDHIAVAIRYEETKMTAPKIVARGQRLMAAKIREIARQHGIPIVRNVPLARALVELELDSEIPSELYEAMAEILRFVYRLSDKEAVLSPSSSSVPEE